MQTTKFGDSSAGAAEAHRVAYPLVPALVSASGPSGERQSDRECPCGDKGEVAPAVLTAIVGVRLEAIASVGCEGVAVVVGHGLA
jgi:hypothetical protein